MALPEYTVAAVVAPAAVVALELWVLRTGLLREGRFWATIAIALTFQVPFDGYLTQPQAPTVQYRADAVIGWYGPWHIPVEDFGFGFALVALTLVLWRGHQLRRADRTSAKR